MNFPTSSIGLPQSHHLLIQRDRVYAAPDGITQVVGPALINPSFAANSSLPLGAFNSQIVSFTIPSGNSQSASLDPYATTISFTLSYSIILL